MSRPHDRSNRSTSAHSSIRPGRSPPRQVPYLPLPSDIPPNPDSPVSELIHEFIRPHHHSQENLETEEELDGAGSEAPVIAKELEEMRGRVWWRRPSALWFLCLIPFALVASTSTSAPKVQVVTYLVCKALRPEYTDRSGADRPSDLFAPDEETKLCNADPVVQAASAEFLTLITTATGILSCLTTAYWGSRSDYKGRINTLRITLFGNLVTDLTCMLVYSLLRDHRGAYWFLLIAPLLEGSLGGLGAASANIHAYIADCTDPARRSRVFSVYSGFVYIGMAVGPALGGLLIRQSGDLKTVFLYAFSIHFIFASMVWFVVPESLAPTQISKAKVAYSESKAQASAGMLAHLESFLAPLKLFLPVTIAKGDNPLKRRKDWNLTILVTAHGLVIMLVGAYSFKFQYAALMFGWTTEMLGYWMSVAGLTRAISLAFVIPAVISLFKRLPSRIQLSSPLIRTTPLLPVTEVPEVLQISPQVPSTQANGITDTRPSGQINADPSGRAVGNKDSSPRLDLNTARVSLIVGLASYTMMATARTGTMFTVYTAMDSLSAGYAPAAQSLALWIYTSRGGEETGKLFGGLGMVQTLGGSIISPMLFGSTYSRTVATFPQAMFVVGASALALALVCTLFIRLPKDAGDGFIIVKGDDIVDDEERVRLFSGDEERAY